MATFHTVKEVYLFSKTKIVTVYIGVFCFVYFPFKIPELQLINLHMFKFITCQFQLMKELQNSVQGYFSQSHYLYVA